jgi:ubiquinone/menaquinone biosynthesis C-methylase UbiE
VIKQVGDGRRAAGAGSAAGPNSANWRLGQNSGAHMGQNSGSHIGSGFGGILSAVARGLCAFLVCTVLVATAVAQERPRHGRLFRPEALGELEGPDRDAWQMPEAVMDALHIADGSHVADVGAGGGWFTVRLARRVGPNGVVYAEDVQSQMLEAIRRRVDREGLRNVRTVKGIRTDPRLPRQSVEAALIVDAYHEFDDPVAMLRGIAAALKPGGSLGVVNFNKSGGGPGPPTDERVDATRVIDEARVAGLTLRRKETFLPFQYFLVFGRADDLSGGGTTAQTR